MAFSGPVDCYRELYPITIFLTGPISDILTLKMFIKITLRSFSNISGSRTPAAIKRARKSRKLLLLTLQTVERRVEVPRRYEIVAVCAPDGT